MEYGIRELKDGELSRALRRASLGEEIVVTDHGRPIAKIVPYDTRAVPSGIAELIDGGKLELRAPLLEGTVPVALTTGAKSAVDYVSEQRR